jgi:hypothetical protein
LAVELKPVLASAVAVGVPRAELVPSQKLLHTCLVRSMDWAAEEKDVEALESLLDLARDSHPIIGPAGADLQREIAVTNQRLDDLRAGVARAQARRDHDLPDIVQPAQFKCPITMSAMQDPVVAVDGFSYERAAIERHFQTSTISPTTGKTLESTTLVPNNALKQMIREHEASMQEQLLEVWKRQQLKRAGHQTARAPSAPAGGQASRAVHLTAIGLTLGLGLGLALHKR